MRLIKFFLIPSFICLTLPVAGVLPAADVKEGGSNYPSCTSPQVDAESLYKKALTYAEGQDVEQDDVAAQALFKMAADQGHPGAQVALKLILQRAYG